MHGLFENVTPSMIRHWSGTFFREIRDSDHNYVMASNVWAEIGKTMENNRKNMPLDFGRPPINIHQHSAAFKAEDWSNWVLLFSLPLLQGHLSERWAYM